MVTNHKIMGIYQRKDRAALVVFFVAEGFTQLCELVLYSTSQIVLREMVNYTRDEFPKIQAEAELAVWDCLYHV